MKNPAEHQGLSETSMQAVKAQLLARWNDTSLTAEQREQTRRAAVLLRVPLPVLVQPSTDFSVQNIPFDQIFLDKARFQPRDDFSEEKVQEIVQNFNPALFKPLIVWKDPSNGKTYVLAGHHRYEALKRMGRKTVPVVYAEGDEQKAVEIAWTENQSGRSQTSAENAKYLRKLAASGRTRAEIQAECKRLYDRSCSVALDLSALNPRGKALVDLTLLHRDTEIFKDVETMAQWIGKLRTRYPELTDAHENEVYDWLREHYKIKGRKLTNSADFLSYMDNVIAKRTQFGKIDERLNIDVVPKSAVAMEYDEQIAHAERELKTALEELNKQRTTALERELKGEITAEQRVRGLQRYEDAVTIAQREVLRLKEAKGRGIRAAKESEISLFGVDDDVLAEHKKKLSVGTQPSQTSDVKDKPTTIAEDDFDSFNSKNINTSLENQGLSDISVLAVKAQLLSRWNNVYVGEDKWEFIQRAAFLLRMPLFVNDGTDRFIIYSATQELFAVIQNILPHARFNVTQNTIHANANPKNYAKCKTITERYALLGAKALKRKAYVKKCVAQKPTVTATIVGNDVHVIFSAAPDTKTITNLRNYKFIKGYGYEQPNSGEMWKARFQPYHREVLRSLFGVTLSERE